jgi:uncharacterized NAD(P)/FAD-binding protein YdhS
LSWIRVIASELAKDYYDVAIVGGGFSAIACALQLAKQAPTLSIAIIEPSSQLPSGIAFSQALPYHLLNVRADGMAWDSELPQDFSEYLQQRFQLEAELAHALFAPRRVYADYLAERLQAAIEGGAKIVHLQARVIHAAFAQSHWQIESDAQVSPNRRHDRHVDRVTAAELILAIGSDAKPALEHPRYFAGPWQLRTLPVHSSDDVAAIVGSGLTAVDCAQSLHQLGWRGRIEMISTRAKLPQIHMEAPVPVWNLLPNFADQSASPLAALRLLRKELKSATALQQDWRAVIHALRPITSTIFARWSTIQRRQFWRHLGTHWANHRHRMPPSVANMLEAIPNLQLRKGRVQSIDGLEHGLCISISGQATMTCALVLDARGPNYRVDSHPLLMALERAGAIQFCPTRLALKLDHNFAPGRAVYALGALGYGQLLECTAVPELRGQAAIVAAAIVRRSKERA